MIVDQLYTTKNASIVKCERVIDDRWIGRIVYWNGEPIKLSDGAFTLQDAVFLWTGNTYQHGNRGYDIDETTQN